LKKNYKIKKKTFKKITKFSKKTLITKNGKLNVIKIVQTKYI